MDVNDTMRSSFQAALHQSIVITEICAVEGSSEFVVDKILPSYWQSELSRSAMI